MEKKIDETIENICSWINDRLNDSMMVEDARVTAEMVSALADLVSTRTDLAIEKRVADLEGQVQSQQKSDMKIDEEVLKARELLESLSK